jgi:ferric-dicitrate binding protein FerR (iron transport regulator)
MKHTRLYILLFFTVAIMLVPVYSNGSADAPPAPAPASGQKTGRSVTVAFVEGVAKVNGEAVDFGDILPTKFIATTEKSARLDIVFNDGNALSIGQNTIVDIDLGLLVPVMQLERGGVTSVLKKLDKIASGDSFKVTTDQTVMGVRGTSFCIWSDAVSTYVCACNGEVKTMDAKGNNEETLVSAHHTARLYTEKDGALTVEEAALLHHTDELVESVAARIGYTIDWTTVDH